MASSPTAYAENTIGIDPDFLYTYNGFIRCSGITKSRIREARLQGIPLPSINVGRRIFVPGARAIEFIETLAKL